MVGEEVVKEDDEELQQRKERSGVVVQEMSDLVNYVIPHHFKVTVCIPLHLPFTNACRGSMKQGATTTATKCRQYRRKKQANMLLDWHRQVDEKTCRFH